MGWDHEMEYQQLETIYFIMIFGVLKFPKVVYVH